MAGHKRLKVRLPPLPLSLGVGQRAIKQADQVTGFRLGCRKHAQVKLVVGDDLEGRTDTHELAFAALMCKGRILPEGALIVSSRILVRLIIAVS